MYTLPLATTLATDAVRRQFVPTAPQSPAPEPAPVASVRARLALAALLERAAHAVAPARYRPAH